MNNLTDKAKKLVTEILVKQGYARKAVGDYIVDIACGMDGIAGVEVPSDPLADTLEGRRQADAVEDWFEQHPDQWDLLGSFRVYVYDIGESVRDWRLDRMVWCLNKLAEEE